MSTTKASRASRSRERDTRGTLLAIGAEEFARHGPGGARIQAICKRAQVNERMIYHHFGSKEGLYTAVLETQWHGLAAAWEPFLAKALEHEPRDGLRMAFVALGKLLFERPLVQRLAMHEAMGGWRYAPRATVDQIPEPLRVLYKRGQKSGAFRREVPFELAYVAFVGALSWRGLFGGRFGDLRAAMSRDPSMGARFGGQLVDLILDGLTPREATRIARTKRAIGAMRARTS